MLRALRRWVTVAGTVLSLALLLAILTEVYRVPFSETKAVWYSRGLAVLLGLFVVEAALRVMPWFRREENREAPWGPLIWALPAGILVFHHQVDESWLGFAMTPGVGAYTYLSVLTAGFFPARLFGIGFRTLIPILARRSLLLLPAGFLLIVVVGSLLLMSPKATPVTGSISFSEAFFTAMSATSVTGLVVVDTGTDFTPFGQGVILVLIQVGGLGFMTIFAFFMMAMGGGLGVSHGLAMREILDQETPHEVRRLVHWIVAATLVTELFGAICLYFSWGPECPYPSGWERFAYSVFHSVSGFCNAGFALSRDSLTGSASNWPVNLTFMGLIVAGGLGFTVIRDAGRYWTYHWTRDHVSRRRPRFGIQSRLVLASSAFLIVLGWVGILVGELVGGEPFSGDLFLGSLFHSVSARTAGFNTTDLATYAPASLLMIILLMFIGASPGSTGGGIKTVTVSLMVLAIASRLRNRSVIEFRRRQIPSDVLQAALVVMGTAIIVLTVLLGLLFLCETSALREGRLTSLALVFEGVSAFSTVGLSLDATSSLTDPSRWVLVVGMFFGRIGPLSLILVMAGTSRVHQGYQYPTGRVMIG